MKNLILFCLTIFTLSFIACSSIKDGGEIPPDNNPKQILTLEERLLSKPGVTIRNGLVRIRGGDQSFFGNSEPLFVINGQAITGGFATVNDMFSANDIKSITVLRTPTELAIYGARGLNGVVKIRLKNGKGEKG